MISIKEAIAAAKKFVREVYVDADEEIEEIGLEEVDRSEDGREWLITIGYTTKKKAVAQSQLQKNFGHMLGGLEPLTRMYKVIHIDAASGEPLTMKIREI